MFKTLTLLIALSFYCLALPCLFAMLQVGRRADGDIFEDWSDCA